MAASRVFATAELLEMILLNLPNIDIVRLRGVNHTWRNATTNSPALREKLFLRVHRSNAPTRANPLLPDRSEHPNWPALWQRNLPRHTIRWAEPFNFTFDIRGCMYREYANDMPIFIFGVALRDDIRTIKIKIPPIVQQMWLTTADSRRPVITLQYEIEGYLTPTIQRLLQQQGKVVESRIRVTVGARIPPSTLGDMLSVCTELAAFQPLPEFQTPEESFRMPSRLLGTARLSRDARDEMSDLVKVMLNGQEVRYVFHLVTREKRGKMDRLLRKLPESILRLFRR